MPPKASPDNGLLIVDKPGVPSPAQPTSHDIVAVVRRWSGQRRIGHTGTLDPMASGVLVLCLGKATRLVEYYQGHDKQYLAEIRLGTATDTYDALGAITARAPVPTLDDQIIDKALDHFRGEIEQIPPAYSAIKQSGESAHRKARRGESFELQPRRVTVHSIELLAFEAGDTIRLRIVCSAGTYIRSLAHDLGRTLDAVAHLSSLRREAAGPFHLGHAYTLEQIERSAQSGNLDELLLPMGAGLSLPRLHLDAQAIVRLGYGQIIGLLQTSPECLDRGWQIDDMAQAIAPSGVLAGIIRCMGPADDEAGASWRAVKWFGEHEETSAS